MKLRCDLHINGGSRKLLLVPGAHETAEHLAMKLAAYILFWDLDPIVEASAKHPALLGQEFIPDLMALDETGAIRLWVECGKVTMHKMGKLTRRHPQARLVILREGEAEAKRLRQDLIKNIDKHEKIQVITWPRTRFQEWMGALRETTEAYGEARETAINLVINEHPLAVDLKLY